MSNHHSKPRFIVAVGASAGGLRALEELFAAVPTGENLCFVVVQHLSPDFQTRMDDILGRKTQMETRVVESGDALRAGVIFLAPSHLDVVIAGDELELLGREGQPHRPIDRLFGSVSEACGERGVAVVLSGTGRDGADGAREVFDAGGLVLVQAPETAQFEGMPVATIRTGRVHRILSPTEVGHFINDLGVRGLEGRSVLSLGRDDAEQTLSTLFEVTRLRHEIDLSDYKLSTVQRRVERRLAAREEGLDQYVARLQRDPDEVDRLYADLLIGVTEFFRDPLLYDALAEHVVPTLLEAAGDTVRIWVTACATGEEAYSMAMFFRDHLDQHEGQKKRLKVFATDVHGRSIEHASAGVYDEEALEGVSEARRERYFERHDDGRWRVREALREMVLFARHDMLRDAPFSNLDLVTCRNLLIYLVPEAQRRVIRTSLFGLKIGGHMVLGPSESPLGVEDALDAVDNRWKVFRKTSSTGARFSPPLPRPMTHDRVVATAKGARSSETRLFRLYDEILERHLAPGIIVDAERHLVHTIGTASRYLRMPSGRVTQDVLHLVVESLRDVLAAALHRAGKAAAPVSYEHVSVTELEEQVDVEVHPLREHSGGAFHVIFRSSDASAAPPPQPAPLSEVARDYVKSLEDELAVAKESLQNTVEELETSNEELQATNQELTAANEELQSTNEELHSVNEELYSVNAENQRRIAELSELSHDMRNLLHSIDVGVLFLDAGFTVRRFTPMMSRLMHLVPSDVGQELAAGRDEQSKIIRDAADEVIAGDGIFVCELEDADKRPYLVRVLPYTEDQTITGVVVVAVDVKDVRQRDARLEELSAIVEGSGDAILGVSFDGHIRTANQAAQELFGRDAETLGNCRVQELFLQDGEESDVRDLLREVRGGESVAPQTLGVERPGGHVVPASVRSSPVLASDGSIESASLSIRDISTQVKAERAAQHAVRVRDRFIANISHELRNPLMGVLAACETLDAPGASEEAAARARATLRRQTAHMARLLDDLLDVSRNRRHGIELRRELTDLRDTMEAVLDMVRDQAEDEGVELTWSTPEDDALLLQGDRDRLVQLQSNLVINAVRYTPSSRKVHYCMMRDGDELVIRVEDDGVGVPMEMQAEIFEPFVHGGLVDAPGRSPGLGLGLALVKTLAEGHGGTVSMRSEGRNKGSTFEVRLPASDEVEEQRPSDTSVVGCRLLFVEDDDDNRELMEELLRLQGFEVNAVGTGSDAVDALESFRPRVAVVDLGLPDFSGLEVARRARASGIEPLFLVALTGHGQRNDREASAEAGFDEHLVKPVEFAVLREVLSTIPEG